MAEMLQTIKGAWKAPELRKKILFTVFILLIYRLGNAVPVPYVDVAALKEYFDTTLNSTVLGLYNAMSGSAFSRATVFALSINPYINSSIIMQLLCIAIPALERLQKDGGEEGRKKIASITRYVTVGLGLIMGFAYYMLIKNGVNGQSMLTADGTGVWPAIVIIMTFMAGSALIMWMGELITQRGVGNGMSLIIFTSIVVSVPSAIFSSINLQSDLGMGIATTVFILLIVLVSIPAIIFVERAQRRIPVS